MRASVRQRYSIPVRPRIHMSSFRGRHGLVWNVLLTFELRHPHICEVYTCVTGTAKRRRDKPGGGSGWSWRAAIRKEGADNAGSHGGGVGSGSAVNTMVHWVARCQKLSWKQVPTCRPVKAIDLSRVEGSRNYDYHQCKTKFIPISQVTCRCMKGVELATLAEVLQKVSKMDYITELVILGPAVWCAIGCKCV